MTHESADAQALTLDNQYDYDAAGNHLGTFHGQTLTTASYDRSNQLVGDGFCYTAEGDPTQYGGASLAYDAEHHLTRYGPPQTPALAAAYGPDGLRAWKDVDGTRTIFYYDGARLIGQQTGENDPVPIVTGLAGVVAYGDTYFLCDPDGNVIQRTDADGALVGTTLYDAWGQQIAGDTPTDPFGYKGQVGYYTDPETGLILCGLRYYDPTLGRWLTRDPAGYDGGENLYGYCANDPENRVDPEGKFWHILIGTALGAVIGGVADCVKNGWSWDNFGRGAYKGAIIGLAASVMGGLAGEGAVALFGMEGGTVAAGAVSGAVGGGVGDAIGQGISIKAGWQDGFSFTELGGSIVSGGLLGGGSVLIRQAWEGVTVTRGGLSPFLRGQMGEAQAWSDALARGDTPLGRQVTFKINGIRVRADMVTRASDGILEFVEAKHGTVRFSQNQAKLFSQWEEGSIIDATPRGGNARLAQLTPGESVPIRLRIERY